MLGGVRYRKLDIWVFEYDESGRMVKMDVRGYLLLEYLCVESVWLCGGKGCAGVIGM